MNLVQYIESEKNFDKSMGVKKFSYLGQFIQGLRTPEPETSKSKSLFPQASLSACPSTHKKCY